MVVNFRLAHTASSWFKTGMKLSCL